MSANTYEINMTRGNLVKNIISFSLPLIASNILQLLYNAADVIVVGRFVGPEALAAVGATSPLISLLLNLFVGMSTGVAVQVSQNYGSKNFARLDNVIHTTAALGIILGIAACILGEAAAKPLLLLMQTPYDVIDGASLYMYIYFIGVPASIIYNFCSAVLRSVGDTKRPLYILTFSGMVNVVLNIFFVIGLKRGVEGVAIATSASNYISAFLVVMCLVKDNNSVHLDIKRIKLHKKECRAIIRIGIPAGIQGMTFNISNVIIQSAVNSFGSAIMAGSTAAGNIEGFIYMSMNAVQQAALTATSQNMGAKDRKRIYGSLYISIAVVTVVGIVMGWGAYFLRMPLLSLYTDNKEIMGYGAVRIMCLCIPYFLVGILEVEVGFMRGIGYSMLPTVISFIGVCGIRITWIYTVFEKYRNIYVLFLAWAVSWVFTLIINTIVIAAAARKRINSI